jgi:transaldolase/glucose-6-phosphate isomerase
MSTVGSLELHPGVYQSAIDQRLAEWASADVAARLVARDSSLWGEAASEPGWVDRLGWLDLPRAATSAVSVWSKFARQVRAEGIERVVVLGMGGSSLAAELFQEALGSTPGLLTVLDSTHPDAISAVESELVLEHTLFVVSSKSGSTLETRSLFDHFWQRAERELADPGRHFVAVTDAGSELQTLAERRGLAQIFLTPADVGGRYSALSAFGLLPAALAGVDVSAVVDAAREADAVLRSDDPLDLLRLGALLGEAARGGSDKLVLRCSASIRRFAYWLEQLVAESTGKHGVGIVPVIGGDLESGAGDRVYVGLLVESDGDAVLEASLANHAAEGDPTVVIRLDGPTDLGFELVRWEVAVALASSILGVDPFSQPDVQRSKELVWKDQLDAAAALQGMDQMSSSEPEADALLDWLSAGPVTYFGLQCFLPASAEADALLEGLRTAIERATGQAVTVGYGPRFLHSTGQLHKGGPLGCRFLQLTLEPESNLAIPGGEMSFGGLIQAQADGDAMALLERGQDVKRLRLRRLADIGALTRRLESRIG